MNKDLIISALMGLVGACNNNPKTENTDMIVLKALALLPERSSCDDKILREILDEIYTEKNVIAPGCAICAMPCGNTSDYDMNRIYRAADDVRKVKLDILTRLGELASDIYYKKEPEKIHEGIMETFYKALSYISYDMEKEALFTFFEEMEELKI